MKFLCNLVNLVDPQFRHHFNLIGLFTVVKDSLWNVRQASFNQAPSFGLTLSVYANAVASCLK